MRTLPLLLPLIAMATACEPKGDDLCARHFQPYPDLVSGTVRSAHNAELVDAMALYAKGRYAEAIPGLQAQIERHPDRADAAWLYLASCYLATGRPYDAELQLDFLERWPGRTYRDETAWYGVLCLLCSGQDDRALNAARAIAGAPRHTYKEQASELVEDLQR